ncbi:hypothetical protein ISN45_At03g009600 [Arabidopsis thaliana x Arabidopsis arenosa]|uniref:Uncharacterized protein n=2 Tax=Arabidopsis TaxID=3701 RepID=A0A8T2F3M0_ARASU|nr:hypothetical protein ISN45_At03g009600 [Arabidopsis thaliana x Arabidopsis arenosa]KAG7630668.1 hypothetical protein ISN44_As03g009710 [Arabidopsis suecica]
MSLIGSIPTVHSNLYDLALLRTSLFLKEVNGP